MYKFHPSREPLLMPFIQFRIASDRWNDVDGKNMIYFDRYGTDYYPSDNGISQQMVDGWCEKRKTERNGSCFTRIRIIVALIRYLQERGLTSVQLPTIPMAERRAYIPHAFTEEELSRFFLECDGRVIRARTESIAARAMSATVIFRLLYSSGLRTIEARLLRVKNVDLVSGVLDIQYSKGSDQHYVVLHDSMLALLRRYDAAIGYMYPSRVFFFPGSEKEPIYRSWIPETFREIWDRVNNSRAVPYDLRHNYATTNINDWIHVGFDFHDKFTFLSKSMGHKHLESTRYYYSIVPALSDLLRDKTTRGLDEIVPEVDGYE